MVSGPLLSFPPPEGKPGTHSLLFCSSQQSSSWQRGLGSRGSRLGAWMVLGSQGKGCCFFFFFLIIFSFLTMSRLRCSEGFFSSCGKWGLLYRCGARFPIAVASLVAECRQEGAGSVVVAQMPCGMWDLPGPGIEPMSPALPGAFFTTEPARKPRAAFQINSSRAGTFWTASGAIKCMYNV